MATSQQKFEQLSVDYTKLQNDLNELVQARQKLETQFQENKIVQDELQAVKNDLASKKLTTPPKVYKQTGSILLPVKFEDSETNVNKRIEFITGEIKRVEAKLKDTNANLEKKRDELIKLRDSVQQQGGVPGAAVAGA